MRLAAERQDKLLDGLAASDVALLTRMLVRLRDNAERMLGER